MSAILDFLRDRIVATTTGLFSHGPAPLEHTLDHPGDPGLCGPDSVTWPVLGDAAAFVGGVRALLVQSAHPEVVAGVQDHSRYREDPLGRLSRTSAYVTATSFGSAPEVEAATDMVRRAHRRVVGESHRGCPYRASDPALAAWVHNTLTHSFLVSYQQYGASPLSPRDADRFVAEQAEIGRLLGADPLPRTESELAAWIEQHPAIAASPGLDAAIAFLKQPPLSWPVRLGYRLVLWAAVATMPADLRAMMGLRVPPGGAAVGALSIRFLRWSLGSSPSWHLALVRTGAPIPDGVFRQPLPQEAEEMLERRVVPLPV
ncbi:MAG: DUF2236 domain-containing protein [Acidimicrobiia bacterium]|nr:DUF2236 domain-containing protein [Acidimicrobiia bacterium]MDH5237170.1 DUF2236 domain-containing protein [Acidimicrobiia bacterium]